MGDVCRKFIIIINSFFEKDLKLADFLENSFLYDNNVIKLLKNLTILFEDTRFKENCSKFKNIDKDDRIDICYKREIGIFQHSKILIEVLDYLNHRLNPSIELIYEFYNKKISDKVIIYIKSNILSPVNCNFYVVGKIEEIKQYGLRQITNNDDKDNLDSRNYFLMNINDEVPENLKTGTLFYGNYCFSESLKSYFFPFVKCDIIKDYIILKIIQKFQNKPQKIPNLSNKDIYEFFKSENRINWSQENAKEFFDYLNNLLQEYNIKIDANIENKEIVNFIKGKCIYFKIKYPNETFICGLTPSYNIIEIL